MSCCLTIIRYSKLLFLSSAQKCDEKSLLRLFLTGVRRLVYNASSIKRSCFSRRRSSTHSFLDIPDLICFHVFSKWFLFEPCWRNFSFRGCHATQNLMAFSRVFVDSSLGSYGLSLYYKYFKLCFIPVNYEVCFLCSVCWICVAGYFFLRLKKIQLICCNILRTQIMFDSCKVTFQNCIFQTRFFFLLEILLSYQEWKPPYFFWTRFDIFLSLLW